MLEQLIALAIVVLMIVAMWKVFAKAGQPGWAIFIPIYNLIVIMRIVGKPWWWLFLFFIPIVNFIVAILIGIRMAKVFGKGTGFGLGITFLGFIFYPILGFGSAEYQGAEVE